MGAATRRCSLVKASVSSGMRRIVLAVSTLVFGMLAFAAPASAATETFNYTGAAQTWIVPAGVTEATFDLYGAQGGGNATGSFVGGLGGRATATFEVVPGGESIQINVGGQGSFHIGGSGGSGGFNGGGNSPSGGFSGGGASDIRIGGIDLDDRVLVAGGGGGAAGLSCETSGGNFPPVWGGDGGGESGKAGLASTAPGCDGSVAGGGGTQTTGGTASGTATAGAFGLGGNGDSREFAGGGGGGWFGGGGGGGGRLNTAAGGGGGSGHGPAGTVFETGVRTGNGLVTITYTPTIATLIESVQQLNLPSGIQNRLLTALNTAQTDLGAGKIAAACNRLGAFISVVNAQSGTNIPAAAAAALVAEAEEVRESEPLGCGPALTCAGQQATIVGTGQRDKLRGTTGDDVIAAQGGEDTVTGLRGDDVVCGGGGNDKLRGMGGDDRLRGGRGNDELRGGGGSNTCRGGSGSDSRRRC